MNVSVVAPSAEGSARDSCWANEDSVMESESSDLLRFPRRRATQRCWDVLWRHERDFDVGSLCAPPNLVRGPACPRRLHIICLVCASSGAEVLSERVMRRGERC